MANRNPIVNAILAGSRQRGLDPRAVLAVASTEGGFRGAIGDQGTSFGPFQLHVGGALPRGRGNAWANSPAGIAYALDQIAKVARGRRGNAAIEAIVRQFERPADPTGQIAKAISRYGQQPGSALGAPPAPSRTGFGGNMRSDAVLGLISRGNELFGLNPLPTFAPTPQMPKPQAKSAGPLKLKGKTLRWLQHFVRPFDVQITSTTGGKHVKSSWHYKGRAVDVAGSPDQMRALAEAALAHPEQFRELFYDPLGVYVKDGKVYRGAIGGHSDHVHLAR